MHKKISPEKKINSLGVKDMNRESKPMNAETLKDEAHEILELMLKRHTLVSLTHNNAIKLSADSIADDVLSSHLLDIYNMGYNDCIRNSAKNKVKPL